MNIEKLNTKIHKRNNFNCGVEELNEFLKYFAYQNQNRYYVGTTYVIHNDTNEIIAFITLNVSVINKTQINASKPYKEIPVLRIARLGVDKKYQKQGNGKRLISFAFKKALELKDNFGCVGVVLEAKPQAESFYIELGFEKINEKSLFLNIKLIQEALK